MSNNNAQLFLKNFSIDLFKFHEPDSLKTLSIDDINYSLFHNIANSGEVVSGAVPAIAGDTTLKLNSFMIKRDNARLFEALRSPTTDGLGGATLSNGNNSQEYSNIKVSEKGGIKQVGNPAEFSDVMLKFIK
jgi:hypothetical protein